MTAYNYDGISLLSNLGHLKKNNKNLMWFLISKLLNYCTLTMGQAQF